MAMQEQFQARKLDQPQIQRPPRSTAAALAGVMQWHQPKHTKVYVHWVTRSRAGMDWFEQLLSEISAADEEQVFEMSVHLTGPDEAAMPQSRPQPQPETEPEPARQRDDYSPGRDAQQAAEEGQGQAAAGSTPHAVMGECAACQQQLWVYSSAVENTEQQQQPPARLLIEQQQHQQWQVVYSRGRPDLVAALAAVHAAHAGETVGVFFCGAKPLSKQLKEACRELNAGTRSTAACTARSTAVSGCGTLGVAACPRAVGPAAGTRQLEGDAGALVRAARPCRLVYHQEIF